MIEMRDVAPASTPDIYFTSEYGRADAEFRGGLWRTASDEAGDWQLPVVTTEVFGGCEATSPYGYSGLYVDPKMEGERIVHLWDATRDTLRRAEVVSLFLRFSPMDSHSVGVAKTLLGLTIVRSGGTYVNSITEPESMWSSMEGRARTAIRKARGAGMAAQVRHAVAADLEAGSPFRDLYQATMGRVGAGEQYSFGDQYFRSLLTIPSSPLHLVEVVQDGEVVAASLVMQHGDLAHYHLSGSDPDAARFGANALLVWAMLEWCSKNEIRTCHLGGGLRDGDGLAKFKRSFGGLATDFFTGRAIIDHDRYDHLARVRAGDLGVTVAALEQTGYFPAYRATA